MKTGSKFSPREMWRQRIGGIQSRNTMVCYDTYLFVGTCGDTWNRRDRNDGVYCLDRANGEVLWFTPTTADVNEICLAGQSLLAPTDAGDVFVLNAWTGEIVNIFRVDSRVLGRPCITYGVGGWTAVFASLSGTFYSISEHSEMLTVLGEITGGLRASLVQLGPSDFLATTEHAGLVKVTVRDKQLLSHQIVQAPLDQKWHDAVSMTASPLLVGHKLFVGYARSSQAANPAMFCVDMRRAEVEWVASDAGLGSEMFGNVRTTPVLMGSRLVVASAYADGVDILDAGNGKFLERVRLGQQVFQQWSNPVLISETRIALGRVDGVCSIVNVRDRSLVASISLATAETERRAMSNLQAKNGVTNFDLSPGEPAPEGGICGTPLYDRGMLFVGTTDGVIIGVRPDGWDSHD